MSDLIVLGVILLALNRLDKIDGESYERNRVIYENVGAPADACDCDRNCQNLHEGISAVRSNRSPDDGEHSKHPAAVQAPFEKS